MHFHVLVLTLNHKSVFSRFDDIRKPHSLLHVVTLLSILIGNVVFADPQEKLFFKNVFITLISAQSKTTNF